MVERRSSSSPKYRSIQLESQQREERSLGLFIRTSERKEDEQWQSLVKRPILHGSEHDEERQVQISFLHRDRSRKYHSDFPLLARRTRLIERKDIQRDWMNKVHWSIHWQHSIALSLSLKRLPFVALPRSNPDLKRKNNRKWKFRFASLFAVSWIQTHEESRIQCSRIVRFSGRTASPLDWMWTSLFYHFSINSISLDKLISTSAQHWSTAKTLRYSCSTKRISN